MEGQFGIKTHAKAVNILFQPIGDGQTAFPQLLLKGVGTKSINFMEGTLLQMQNGGIDRSEKVLRFGFYAQSFQLVHIAADTFGRIVGEVHGSAADALHMSQKIQRAVKQLLIQINGAVHIQQKQTLVF